VGRLFGTDGVRGKANEALTAELALCLSVAAVRVLGEKGEFHGHSPFAVVGRDPRASGEFLEAAVIAGLASAASTSYGSVCPLPDRISPRIATPISASCCQRVTTRCPTTGSSLCAPGANLDDALGCDRVPVG
jgi:hypothetical protein